MQYENFYTLQSALIQFLVVASGYLFHLLQKWSQFGSYTHYYQLYCDGILGNCPWMWTWSIFKKQNFGNYNWYLLHSLLLVPYFRQRSHSVHHRFTNNVTNGETHSSSHWGNGITEKVEEIRIAFSNSIGKNNYGILQLVLHLIFGWLYLLTGSTGGINMELRSFWFKTIFQCIIAINMD